jgi:hypothetical protein
MIIDSDYCIDLQDKHMNFKIVKLSDSSPDFCLSDLFVDFPKKHLIYIHSFPIQEHDIDQIIKFCECNPNFYHIIILTGQSVPMYRLANFCKNKEKIFVLNPYGYSTDNFFPVINNHRMMGKIYLKKVPYIPWHQRKYNISSLSSRFEAHRWILTGHLHLMRRKDIIFSFHNAYPRVYDVKEFVSVSKYMCDFEVDEKLRESIRELIDQAPVIPQGMHNPRPHGKTTEKSVVYDQCELNAYLDSRVNLTMEGQFLDTGYGCNITEKTLKCLATGSFPIHVGQSGFYGFLESMGFKFDVGIDLSFDRLQGECRRRKLEMLIGIIKNLSCTEQMEKISKFNYDWFHNYWYDRCEQLNRPVLDKLKERIDRRI